MYEVTTVLQLAASLGTFDSRAFVSGLFSHLSLREEQLLELSERAGSVRLTARVRADGARQAGAIAQALATQGLTERLLLGRALGVVVLAPPLVTVQVKIEDAGPPRSPPRPPLPPMPRPPETTPPPSLSPPPVTPYTDGEAAVSAAEEAEWPEGTMLAMGVTLGLVGFSVLLCLLCRKYGRRPPLPEWVERKLHSRIAASRKQRPMLSHGADVTPVVHAPMPWETGSQPLAIEMTAQGEGSSYDKADAAAEGGASAGGFYSPPVVGEGEVHAPVVLDVAAGGEGVPGGGHVDGYTYPSPQEAPPPPTPSLSDQQGHAAPGMAAAPDASPAVPTPVSARREAGEYDAGTGQPRPGARGGDGKRKVGKADRKSGSGQTLLPKALHPRGRQGCMTAPASTPQPVVYSVDEEGVGALPPTQSFARGEVRYTDEQMVTL